MKKTYFIWLWIVAVCVVIGLAAVMEREVSAEGIHPDITFEGTPTNLVWGTPVPNLTLTPRSNYPCTPVQATSVFRITSSIFPTIQMTNLPANTPVPEITMTYVPTLVGFALGSYGIVRKDGGSTADISCGLAELGTVIQCYGEVDTNYTTGSAIVYVNWTMPHGTMYYAYQNVWEWGDPINWGMVRIDAYTGYNWSNHHDWVATFGDQEPAYGSIAADGNYTTRVEVSSCRADEHCKSYFNIRMSNNPFDATPVPTLGATATATAFPCQPLPYTGGSDNPIASIPVIEYSYGGCVSIVPAFRIPLLGAWGLADIVVPAVSMCVMWVNLHASFMGIQLEFLLSAFITLGLGFAIFNEFRS